MKMQLESLIEQLMNKYEHIAEIHIAHPDLSGSETYIHVKVHTGEAESIEEYLDIVPSGNIKVKTADERSWTLPVTVMATYDGPGNIQRTSGTTIYMSDDVIGAESRDIETGISMFRKKLVGMCPHCGAEPESLIDHYRDNMDCAAAEEGRD